MKSQKKSSLLFLSLLLATSSLNAGGSISQTAKDKAGLIMGLLGMGGSIALVEFLKQNNSLGGVAEQCNMSEEDLESTLTTAAFLTSISLLPFQGDFSSVCRQFVFRTPFFAGLVCISSSKTFKSVVKNIPVVGKYFGACSNRSCEGICNNCKLRNGILNATLWFNFGIPTMDWIIESKFGTTIGLQTRPYC